MMLCQPLSLCEVRFSPNIEAFFRAFLKIDFVFFGQRTFSSVEIEACLIDLAGSPKKNKAEGARTY